MSYILREKFRPPSETLYLTEPFRAIFELATLHLSEPWLNSLKGGDGHPVLVIPGFTAGDRSTALLRHFLSRLGYPPCGHLINLVFAGNHRDRVEKAAAGSAGQLGQISSQLQVLGPAPCLLARLRGKWRCQILLRAASRNELRRALPLVERIEQELPSGIVLAVDVDPVDMF